MPVDRGLPSPTNELIKDSISLLSFPGVGAISYLNVWSADSKMEEIAV